MSGITTTEYSIFSALEGQHGTLQIPTLVDISSRCLDGHFYCGPLLSVPSSAARSNLRSKIVIARRVSSVPSVFLDDSDHANENSTIITFVVKGPTVILVRAQSRQTNSSSFTVVCHHEFRPAQKRCRTTWKLTRKGEYIAGGK